MRRVGLVNITNLTRVRDTFKPGWRGFIAVTFLLSVFFWWVVAHGLRSLSPIVDDATLRTRTLILAAVVLAPLTAALLRRDDFARLFFVLAIVFNVFTLTLLLLALLAAAASPVPLQDGMAVTAAFVGALSVVAVYARHLIHPCYVLLLSLIPFGRRKAFRLQVLYCLRLWAGRWKEAGAPPPVGAGERPYLNSGTKYRLALGGAAFALGLVVGVVALFGILNRDFLPAVARLELLSASRMLSNFEITPPAESADTAGEAALQVAGVALAFLPGLGCFFVAGFFWTQWRRENVTIYDVPLLRHMTASDLLLLRSFDDDVKYVTRTGNNVLTLIFRVYQWSFTFEEVLVNRLKYLGQVRLLDIRHERKELLEKPGLTLVARVLGSDRLRRFLISVFPAVWYKLPARGGIRYYVDKKGWEEEVDKAATLARLIVVVLGTSEGLEWEMRLVTRLRLSEKTTFVMPPLFSKKNRRARWRRFVEVVCVPQGFDRRLLLEKVNPKRVLAVTFYEDTLVVIEGKSNSQPFYESALDVAALLAVDHSGRCGMMIPKYLG